MMVEKRRRGTALEEAILKAAWAELLERGYGGFTMEAVAKRAGTSRPVLGRRWESRSDLAIAAIANFNRNNPVELPDFGNVRDDLITVLQKVSDRAGRIMIRVLLGMSEYFLETGSSLADMRQRIIGDSRMKEILERGVRRGELDRRKLTPRIASLPLDLVRHEVIMNHKPVSRAVIEEIVDTIFLPLAARSARD
jgi:AcrR family transcriptional regulator